jgi:hypothetical protein
MQTSCFHWLPWVKARSPRSKSTLSFGFEKSPTAASGYPRHGAGGPWQVKNWPVMAWTLVRANDKHLARLNVIDNLLGRLRYAGKDVGLIRPDPRIVFRYVASSPHTDQPAK